MSLWCWLFASCVAVAPPSAPTAPHAEAPPGHAGAPRAHLAVPHPSPLRLPVPPVPPAASALPAPPPPVAVVLPQPAPSPAAASPAWQRRATEAPAADGKPTITIVLDDMGLTPALSARAAALPGPVALAWVPFAPHLAEQVAAAGGHEAVLDMPMEGFGRSDPGPHALRTWQPPAANRADLRAALDALPGAVALTEREGNIAVLSVPLMALTMGELRARGVGFLDRLAVPQEVALPRADAAGVAVLVRDVVLDADPNPLAIRAQLAEGEAVAQRQGHAVLVGHARAATLDVLDGYLPGLAARGIVLWPLSASLAARAHVQNSAGIAATQGHAPAAAVPAGAVAPPRGSGAE